MSHRIHCLRAGIYCAPLVLALGTCNSIKATDAFTALEITQVQVIDGTNCSVPGTKTPLHRTHGTMDVEVRPCLVLGVRLDRNAVEPNKNARNASAEAIDHTLQTFAEHVLARF